MKYAPFFVSIIILLGVIYIQNNHMNKYKTQLNAQIEKTQKDSLEYNQIIDSCAAKYVKELKKNKPLSN